MLREMFEKLMKSKEGERKMSNPEVKARENILSKISEDAEKQMGEKLGGHLQKVSVMAKDKKGLEKGLDKAKEVLGQLPEGETEEHEASELPEEEQKEMEEGHELEEGEMSEEDLDKKLKELMALKEKMKSKKSSY